MKPAPITDDDVEAFGPHARRIIMGAPPGMEGCIDVEAIIGPDDRGYSCIRIPRSTAIPGVLGDLAGRRVWLSIWGTRMPPVGLVVET